MDKFKEDVDDLLTTDAIKALYISAFGFQCYCFVRLLKRTQFMLIGKVSIFRYATQTLYSLNRPSRWKVDFRFLHKICMIEFDKYLPKML